MLSIAKQNKSTKEYTPVRFIQATDKTFCLNSYSANWCLYDLLLVIYENSDKNNVEVYG